MSKKNSDKRNQIEEKIIDIEIEKSRLNREKSIMVLDKAVFLYFSFLFIAVIGFVNQYISRNFLNVLIGMGLCVLIIGTLPYITIMSKEEKNLDKIINTLKRMEGGD